MKALRAYLMLLLLSLAGQAWADGVVRDGVGAISAGRGGTNLAHWDNGAVLLDNPAGIVNIAGNSLAEVSIDSLITDLHYSDPEDDQDAELQVYPLPAVTYIRRRSERFAWGLGAFGPAGFGAAWDLNNSGITPAARQFRYKSFGALGKILPSMAYQVTDRLSVGGTVGVGISHIELEGPFFVQNGFLAGTPTVLDLQVTGATPVWSVGIQYRYSDQTTIGLAYTSKSDLKLDGTARVSVDPLGTSGFDADLEMTWPRSLGLGISHSFCEHRRLSGEAVWYDWSSAFDRFVLWLNNPDNPAFALAGLPPGSTYREEIPLFWRDSVALKMGYEHGLSDTSVGRIGYIYHRNTIPTSTLTPYLPAILQHVFTLGYGRQCSEWRFDAAYQYSFGQARNVGTSALSGGDFSMSRVSSQAHWVLMSLSKTW